jgi:hypothetical protein
MEIHQTLKPFYILSKIFGLFPMRFVKSSYIVSWFGVFFSSLACLFMLALTLTTIIRGEQPQVSSEIASKFWTILSITGLVLLCVQFVIQMKNFRAFPDFVAKVHEFDEKVESIHSHQYTNYKICFQAKTIGIFINHHKVSQFIRNLAFSMVLATIPLYGAPAAGYLFDVVVALTELFPHCYLLFHNFFYSIQFIASTYILKTRLKVLNKSLK